MQMLTTSLFSFAHVAVNAPEAYVKPTVLEKGMVPTSILVFFDSNIDYDRSWKSCVERCSSSMLGSSR